MIAMMVCLWGSSAWAYREYCPPLKGHRFVMALAYHGEDYIECRYRDGEEISKRGYLNPSEAHRYWTSKDGGKYWECFPRSGDRRECPFSDRIE